MASSKRNNSASPHLSKRLPPDLLKCPVCNDQFKTPRLLPCLHSFCENCLDQSFTESRIGPGQGFLCPICRNDSVVPNEGAEGFRQNVFFETLEAYMTRKAAPRRQQCTACDDGELALRKCVECDDWLCGRCCTMHVRVKLTKNHHLVAPEELDSGRHDDLIKQTLAHRVCQMHREPLKLYCTEPQCQMPICTICKTTYGHDGHQAIEIQKQAQHDLKEINLAKEVVNNSSNSMSNKLEVLKKEEKAASMIRKRLHKEINNRMEEVVAQIAEQIGTFAQTLHDEVDDIVAKQKLALTEARDDCKFDLKAMQTAQNFSHRLVQFGRDEEIVALSVPVLQRLSDFRSPPDPTPPFWRQPRLFPPGKLDDNQITKLFGRLTFEGESIKCVHVRTFSTKLDDDEKQPSLSDVTVTDDNDVLVIDRDNRRLKVFDSSGSLLFASHPSQFNGPNRVTCLPTTGNALIKDDKALYILQPDGVISGTFAPKLRHPVASTRGRPGEVFVTDWVTGCVHCFSEDGEELFKYPTSMEAPAYVTANMYGKVFVSDWKQNLIRGYDYDGKFIFQYGSGLDHPYGIALDKYNNVLVADNWNNRIQMISPEGRFLRYVLTKDDGITFPQALAVNSDGHLVIAELNGAIKIYQYLA